MILPFLKIFQLSRFGFNIFGKEMPEVSRLEEIDWKNRFYN